MIWNLDPSWLLMAIATVSILSFILGMALNGLLGKEGFGAAGNATVITGGFFTGIFAANIYGMHLSNLQYAIAVGLAGGFAFLFVLVTGKSLLKRI